MKKACIEKGGLKAFTCTQAVMDWHLMAAQKSQKFCVVVPGEVTNYVVPTLIASTGLTGTSGAFLESNLHHQSMVFFGSMASTLHKLFLTVLAGFVYPQANPDL